MHIVCESKKCTCETEEGGDLCQMLVKTYKAAAVSYAIGQSFRVDKCLLLFYLFYLKRTAESRFIATLGSSSI
jgi:hypothetical protein